MLNTDCLVEESLSALEPILNPSEIEKNQNNGTTTLRFGSIYTLAKILMVEIQPQVTTREGLLNQWN